MDPCSDDQGDVFFEAEEKAVERRRLPIIDSISVGGVLDAAETQIGDPPGFFFAAMPTPRTPQPDQTQGNKSKALARKTRAAKLTAEAAAGAVRQGINDPLVASLPEIPPVQGMGGQELPSRNEAPGEKALKAGPLGQAGASGGPLSNASPGPTPGRGPAESGTPSPRKRPGPKQAGSSSAKKKPGANLGKKD
jgi:hypothetical protein